MDPHICWSKAGRPAQTFIQQLCEDTGCSPEDLPEAMNDREKWRERVRDIRASGTTWWLWRHRTRWPIIECSLDLVQCRRYRGFTIKTFWPDLILINKKKNLPLKQSEESCRLERTNRHSELSERLPANNNRKKKNAKRRRRLPA